MVELGGIFVGAITQLLAPRKGTVLDLRPGDPGRTVMSFEAPARGLLGLRGQLLTNTRGTAMMHTRHRGWAPWFGDLPHRRGGAMIADHVTVPVTYVPNFSAVADRVAEAAGPGDVVVTMGAGDVTMLGKEILAALRVKANRSAPGGSGKAFR